MRREEGPLPAFFYSSLNQRLQTLLALLLRRGLRGARTVAVSACDAETRLWAELSQSLLPNFATFAQFATYDELANKRFWDRTDASGDEQTREEGSTSPDTESARDATSPCFLLVDPSPEALRVVVELQRRGCSVVALAPAAAQAADPKMCSAGALPALSGGITNEKILNCVAASKPLTLLAHDAFKSYACRRRAAAEPNAEPYDSAALGFALRHPIRVEPSKNSVSVIPNRKRESRRQLARRKTRRKLAQTSGAHAASREEH